MKHLRIDGRVPLVLGLLIVAGCFAPAVARAHAYGSYMDCGARRDFCVQACDYNFPGGLALGMCYDYCSKGTGICQASQIPVPVSYRLRYRSK